MYPYTSIHIYESPVHCRTNMNMNIQTLANTILRIFVPYIIVKVLFVILSSQEAGIFI